MPDDEEFRPAWWLPGPHLQALWGALMRSPVPLTFRRESVLTPDGDELVMDHVDGDPGAPRVLLLHGLEGSSQSSYVLGMADLAAARGWNVTALNFRHCARDLTNPALTLPNRLPRLYHSGDSQDVGLIVRTLAARQPDAPLFAAGASLGGSMLLKYLGESGDQCPLSAAMIISVPFDLKAGEENLATRIGSYYLQSFLRTLMPKVNGIIARFPEVARVIDVEKLARSKRFRDMDGALTAPLHGFASADEYYARCTSLGFLSRVRVPTLALAAEDDPFVAPGVIERVRRESPPDVRVVGTRHGGHVGFVSGTPWNPSYFTEQLFVSWFERWVHALDASAGASEAAA